MARPLAETGDVRGPLWQEFDQGAVVTGNTRARSIDSGSVWPDYFRAVDEPVIFKQRALPVKRWGVFSRLGRQNSTRGSFATSQLRLVLFFREDAVDSMVDNKDGCVLGLHTFALGFFCCSV